MSYQYVVIAGRGGDETLPVNTPAEIAAAESALRDAGESEAVVWALPAAPQDGGDYADAVETSSRIWPSLGRLEINLDDLTEEQATAIAEALDGDDDHDETIQALARAFGESALWADDGNQAYECTASDTAAEAAREYVDGGDWGDDASGFVEIYVWRQWTLGSVVIDDERESHIVPMPIEVPACSDDREHDWQSRVEIVGGLEGNPGVRCHGGGVIIHEVCDHCGALRTTDTWAQHGGVQGLTSVSYETDDHEHHDAWAQWRSAHGDDAEGGR